MDGIEVRDLIRHLAQMPQEAKIVTLGHFGEPHEYSLYDFTLREYQKGESPGGLIGAFLVIETKDIGPEPD
jgi:hypothetical protein